MPTPFTPKEDAFIFENIGSKSLSEIGEKLGRSRNSINTRWRALREDFKKFLSEQYSENSTPSEFISAQENIDGSMTILCKSKTIHTIDELIKECEIDLAIWEIERVMHNKWDGYARTRSFKAADDDWRRELSSVELFQVKIWLRRRVAKCIEQASDDLIKRMKAYSPKNLPKTPVRNHVDGHLLEVDLFDAHFGKLAWAAETGVNYDLKLAEKIYDLAAVDLLRATAHVEVDRFLYPIGNDFMHVDNMENTTSAGTPQDMDGRLFKVYSVGCASIIKAIERCARIAPVDVVWVPGNHDYMLSHFLAREIKVFFMNNPHVSVDIGVKARKYVEYGCNLIGFTHGDQEAHNTLPSLMANEEPNAWARTRIREFHVGHLHKKKETHYNTADTFNSVVVRTLRSLSGTDAWHFKKGYVKTIRAAEAFLWSKQRGLDAYFNAYVPDLDTATSK